MLRCSHPPNLTRTRCGRVQSSTPDTVFEPALSSSGMPDGLPPKKLAKLSLKGGEPWTGPKGVEKKPKKRKTKQAKDPREDEVAEMPTILGSGALCVCVCVCARARARSCRHCRLSPLCFCCRWQGHRPKVGLRAVRQDVRGGVQLADGQGPGGLLSCSGSSCRFFAVCKGLC